VNQKGAQILGALFFGAGHYKYGISRLLSNLAYVNPLFFYCAWGADKIEAGNLVYALHLSQTGGPAYQ
jgi:hypothetical protein